MPKARKAGSPPMNSSTMMPPSSSSTSAPAAVQAAAKIASPMVAAAAPARIGTWHGDGLLQALRSAGSGGPDRLGRRPSLRPSRRRGCWSCTAGGSGMYSSSCASLAPFLKAQSKNFITLRLRSASVGFFGSRMKVGETIGQEVLALLVDQAGGHPRYVDQSAFAAAGDEAFLGRLDELAGLVAQLGGDQLVGDGIGVLDIADGAADVLHRAGDALVAARAGAGGEADRGADADLLLPLRGNGGQVGHPDEGRAEPSAR